MNSEETRDDDDMLAAEYALGLLTGAEQQQAQQRARTDRAFAQAVTAWDIKLASMAETLAPETPRAMVKTALMADLFAAPARPPFWQRLWVWQAASVLSLALLAAVLALGFSQPPVTAGPIYTAEISAPEGDFRVVAVVDKSTNEVFLTRTAGAAPAGRILQVWAHGEGAPATSVGLWPEGDTVRLPMPQEIAAVEGILTLGVSEEPVGGSPTGSPSGRVFGTVDIPGVVNDA